MAATKKPRTARTTKKPTSEADFVEIGSRFSALALVDHWATVRPKVKAAGARFARFKFDADRLKVMDGLSSELRVAAADRAQKGADRMASGVALAKASTGAKDWRRDAHTYLANAGQPARDGSATSAKRLLASLDLLLPRLDGADVKAEGADAAFVAQGKAAKTALVAAMDAHAEALGALSPDARAVHAKKGELHELLKKAARVARNVVPSEAHLFSLKHLHSAKAAKKPAPSPDGAKK